MEKKLNLSVLACFGVCWKMKCENINAIEPLLFTGGKEWNAWIDKCTRVHLAIIVHPNATRQTGPPDVLVMCQKSQDSYEEDMMNATESLELQHENYFAGLGEMHWAQMSRIQLKFDLIKSNLD